MQFCLKTRKCVIAQSGAWDSEARVPAGPCSLGNPQEPFPPRPFLAPWWLSSDLWGPLPGDASLRSSAFTGRLPSARVWVCVHRSPSLKEPAVSDQCLILTNYIGDNPVFKGGHV